MNCPSCHKILPDNTGVCPYCGTLLQNAGDSEAPLPKLTRLKKMPSLSNDKSSFSNNVAPKPLGTIDQPFIVPEQPIAKPHNNNVNIARPVTPSAPAAAPMRSFQSEPPAVSDSANTARTNPISASADIKPINEDITESVKKEDKAGKKGFFSKPLFSSKKGAKSQDSIEDSQAGTPDSAPIEENPEDIYDTNYDGYYDDLIPDLAKQINKIPQENVIKGVLCIVFGIIACGIILVTL